LIATPIGVGGGVGGEARARVGLGEDRRGGRGCVDARVDAGVARRIVVTSEIVVRRRVAWAGVNSNHELTQKLE